MKIAILGLGREGKTVLKFLKKRNHRADIKILDQKLDKNYLKNLSRFDLVFRSPGVPYNLPKIQKAIKKGVEFSGSTALFFQEAKKIGCKIIGITGTKGKGTTSTLLYKILKGCGRKAFLAGNVGKPAIELIPRLSACLPRSLRPVVGVLRGHPRPPAIACGSGRWRAGKSALVILELSSFQLQDLNYSPDIAVILDIFPDHLDAHKNLKEYLAAKSAISKFQNPNDKVFYFSNNKYSRFIAQKSLGRKIPVGRSFSNSRELEKRIKSVIKMPGEHNLKNALMAATVALSLGCPKNKIIKTVRNFRGNEHRLELVRKIKGISFYNDSASTNPQTAAAAIKAFKEPKILISGGKDKGLNYSPLAKALKNSNTKLVILFGENKNKIKRQIAKSKVQIVLVKDLKSSVQLAYKKTKSLITHNSKLITILFSPASASFDMFKDYAERGEKFKKIVKKLK